MELRDYVSPALHTSAPFQRSWRAKTVLMSPPYSDKLSIRAARKFLKEWRRGRFEQAIVLVNEAPDCPWYNLLVHRASSILPDSRFETSGGPSEPAR